MPLPDLGVVVVSYNGADVLLDCLESLWASDGVRLTVVVVDNGSTDGTPQLLRDWAAGRQDWMAPADLPFACTAAYKPIPLSEDPADWTAAAEAAGHRLLLLDTGLNAGFAGGVNRGLEVLAAQPGIDRFWVLNPDSAVPPGTARAFATAPEPDGGFSLMGGRVLYMHDPDMIQIDGGYVHPGSGITGNVNLGASHVATPLPDASGFDFITGASMVASRRFYEIVGPMREDYFLYYEEVDWALRRGDLPLAFCPDALLYHRAGASIGSPTLDRPAAPFSLYFKHRARRMFLHRFFPGSRLIAHAWTLGKAGQYMLRGYRAEALALLRGSFGLAPPAAVRARLSDEAKRRIGLAQ
ncbi:glycosyltransferase family 2 protein [Pseudooceanicola onchidii]|uniref:glycosyltransferase family 2 protein n=1 Tax=Pseudooceanicola onchidii TaxID=2562279 RepID=UPI0010A9FF15|nr:glycosyltransferase family 2 protein [Pseudooceanicola onchidii]